MQTRVRQKLEYHTGYRTQRFSPYAKTPYSYTSRSETCTDLAGDGAGDNQAFTVSRIIRSGGLISGTEASVLTGYIWDNYPCSYSADPYMTSHLTISGQPSDGLLSSQILARTQPLRASTVLWEYLDSLAGLGSLAHDQYLKALGRLRQAVPPGVWKLLNRAAKLNLLYQFGIVPLISDIETLLKFQHLVDKRVDELKRLYGPRGLRRTLDMWRGSNTATLTNVTIQSNGVLLHATVNKVTTIKVRAHVRWHALIPLPKSESELRAMAKRAILGSEIDPYVVYELMPWSWFIDYFLNLGNLVKAAKNMTTVTHDQVRIMEHLRTRVNTHSHTASGTSPNRITCTPMRFTSETKRRRLTTPTLTAQTEMLNANQLSILGSLAVLKAK